MNLLPSLLSFATLIQVINCRLLEPTSPLVAETEQHDHVKEHSLFADLFKMRSSKSDDQCESVWASYYEKTDYYEHYYRVYKPLLSHEAIDERNDFFQDFADTGVLDMSDSEFFVPEYISNICDSDREDMDLDSAVTYLLSFTVTGSACVNEIYNEINDYYLDQVQFINFPECYRSTCTVDGLIASLANLFADLSDYYDVECNVEDVTVTEGTNTTAKESIMSID